MRDASGLDVTYLPVVDPDEAALGPLSAEQRAGVATWVARLRAHLVPPSEALGLREQLEAWVPPGPDQDRLIRWIESVRPHDDDTLPSWMFCEG